jgi:hypothetical protein
VVVAGWQAPGNPVKVKLVELDAPVPAVVATSVQMLPAIV